MWLSHRNPVAHTVTSHYKSVALNFSWPDWTLCEKKLKAQWGQAELRAKPGNMGTPRETHLPLGYASIGLSRQAGGGEKQQSDASKLSATGTPKQITQAYLCACVLPVRCPRQSIHSLQRWWQIEPCGTGTAVLLILNTGYHHGHWPRDLEVELATQVPDALPLSYNPI